VVGGDVEAETMTDTEFLAGHEPAGDGRWRGVSSLNSRQSGRRAGLELHADLQDSKSGIVC
jgi:hypothetical protein